MSLINEALKRAKESQDQQQKPRRSDKRKAAEPAMRPVEAKPKSTSPMVFVLSAALVLVLLGAVALLWAWNKSSQPQATRVAQPAATPTVELPVIMPAAETKVAVATPAAVQPSISVEAQSSVTTAAPAPHEKVRSENLEPRTLEQSTAVAEVESQPTPELQVPVPQFPALKLQGIFYNSVNPAAVVNGKTYSVGGVISGARITKIEPDRITVEWNGETRVIETAH
ncbi:MAG: hypothetical protein ACK4UN_02535 [Limisphaerales bacterium]